MPEGRLTAVEVDALVVLKIMKHCRDQLPNFVTGQLCGLDTDDKLEVTHCFPYKSRSSNDEDEDSPEGTQQQLEMLKYLRQVNVDSNTVGWYQSTYFGDFLNALLIETMFSYQDSIQQAAVLVFDPMQAEIGKNAFKAFRLTDEFMRLYRESRSQKGAAASLLAHMPSSRVLEELPVVVKTSALVDAFLLDLPKMTEAGSQMAVMEKNIQFLLECLDDLAQQQWRLQQHEKQALRQQQQQKAFTDKRRQENAARRERGEDLLAEQEGPTFKRLQAPSQLDTLLISSQIQTYCKHINSFAGDSLCKLFLVGGLQ